MSKSLLLVCPSCARHVRAVDSSCPFCGLLLSETARASLALRPARVRLGRAARYALSMGTISLAAACGGDQLGENEAGGGDSGSGFDAACCPPYGQPLFDGGVEDVGVTAPPEAGDVLIEEDAGAGDAFTGGDAPSEGAILPPYGLPPIDSGK